MVYQVQAIDTSVDADRQLFTWLRQRSNQERMAMAMASHASARKVFLAGLQRRYGEVTPWQVANAYWESLPPDFQPGGNPETWMQDPITLAIALHPLLEALEIPYYISGGVAAIFYGEYRTTRDVDLVLSLLPGEIAPLAQALEAMGFYVAGLDEAIAQQRGTLQAIHRETLVKADLTLARDEEFELIKFSRRRLERLNGEDSGYLITPEDLILSKLRWRQRSQSEKQWRDILGILKVQTSRLDLDYLHQWANQLQLRPQLDNALGAAGLLNP